MTRRVDRGATVFVLAMLVASCGSDENSSQTETSEETTSSSESTETTTDSEAAATTETSAESESDSEESDSEITLETVPPSDKTTTTVAEEDPTTTGDGDDVGEAQVGSGPIDAALQPFIDDAVGQLAASLSIDASTITVQSAQVLQWPDASAGCPQPGMQYAQVLTDGSAIELVASGTSYWFHTGGSSTPTLCESSLRQSPPNS